jgi:hypothetical protein
VIAVAERLAARTEALVRIPSESRHEETILDDIRRHLPAAYRVVDDRDSLLLAMPERRPGRSWFSSPATSTRSRSVGPPPAAARARPSTGEGPPT